MRTMTDCRETPPLSKRARVDNGCIDSAVEMHENYAGGDSSADYYDGHKRALDGAISLLFVDVFLSILRLIVRFFSAVPASPESRALNSDPADMERRSIDEAKCAEPR